ncbi:MAG: AI-2E family transporter [Gammaproteobacteria bacterium]|nr:AI-2E family transporter [Gammaproteobacteria bacterium]
MLDILKDWYEKHFSDPQVVILALIILSGIAIIFFLGDVLAPVLAGIVIAYVLEGLVLRICKLGAPRSVAIAVSFSLFITSIILLLFGLIPLVSKQLTQLITNLPGMLNKAQQLVMTLPEKFPALGSDQLEKMVASFNAELVNLGQTLLSVSLDSVVDVFTLLVFLVVVPLLVFFLLKDKQKIVDWLQRFLPEGKGLAYQVWHDVDIKMGNYIRGKLLEILIVGVATFIPLKIMDLNYAATLSLFVGLSVIIPYVGAVAVTIPVALIAWFQWGASSEFVYLMGFYLLIQFLDGNILVPLLFSEVVDMHPAAIIIAVLVFGGLWGVWGVFFAIPLATLIQSVLNAWPSMQLSQSV